MAVPCALPQARLILRCVELRALFNLQQRSTAGCEVLNVVTLMMDLRVLSFLGQLFDRLLIYTRCRDSLDVVALCAIESIDGDHERHV
jgi:hypothetical protein